MTTNTENHLLKQDGYMAEFYTMVGDYPDKKYYEVWMKLEEKRMRKHGVYKYKNYSAFKTAKSRYQKR
jgi:hypothetical protein